MDVHVSGHAMQLHHAKGVRQHRRDALAGDSATPVIGEQPVAEFAPQVLRAHVVQTGGADQGRGIRAVAALPEDAEDLATHPLRRAGRRYAYIQGYERVPHGDSRRHYEIF